MTRSGILRLFELRSAYMFLLLLGLIIFFAVHSISIVNEPWRNAMLERMGPAGWRLAYSVVALIGLVLIVYGYGLARQQPLLVYMPTLWMHRIAVVLLIPVTILLLATYLPGRISAAAKHPMLLAIKLWALAHLLANGMVSDLFLFGSFLVWAVIGRISMKRRQPRSISLLEPSTRNDVIAIVGGLLLYGFIVLWLHGVLFGVAPSFV